MISRYIRTISLGIALAGLPLTAAHAQLGQSFTGTGTYTGNGGAGFGGSVGSSSLTLSYNNSTGTINGSFTSPNSFPTPNNSLVLYLGVNQSGIANTSTLNDNGDGGRTAISGVSSSGRTLVTFANGFRPTYALSIEPGNFAGLFNLSTPNSFGFVSSANIAGAGTTASPLTFSFTVASLGLTPSVSNNIDFVGTLISTTAYLSNETIGTSVTTLDPTNTGTAPNAGFTGSQTFSAYNRLTTFAVTVPEAGSVALVGIGILPLAGIVLRRRFAN